MGFLGGVIGAVGAVGSIIGGKQERKAISRASDQQAAAYESGIEEQRRQFDALQELLKPYVTGGQEAFGSQQKLIGLGTPEEQAAAIAQLEQSPMMKALVQKGENALLQNASATGGLRGGNTAAALAQFRPQMLAQLIEGQFSKLGGLSSLGANSAAMQGNTGMNMASNIGNLLGQIGSARSGATLSRSASSRQGISDLLGLAGNVVGGLGGFGG